MSTGAVDFVKAISGNAVKNGSMVLGAPGKATAPLAYNDPIGQNAASINTPTMTTIQGKYAERFDDPTYYSN